MRSDSFVKFFEIVNDPEVFQFKGINLTKFYYDKFVARFTDYKQAMKKPLSQSRLLGLFVRLREVIPDLLYDCLFRITQPKAENALLWWSKSNKH